MISIVVPMYNEEEMAPVFLETFFNDVHADEEYELIVVNDGSTDRTKEIIEAALSQHDNLRLVSYDENRNLGYALQRGFDAARGRVIVTMDSDLAHPPFVIPQLVSKFDEGFDVVIGSRYVKGAGISGVPGLSNFLSRATVAVTRLICWSGIKDVTTGFRCYDAQQLRNITLQEVGFEVELELLIHFLKSKAKIAEVGFSSVDRPKGESKFILRKHGPRYVKAMMRLFKYRWA